MSITQWIAESQASIGYCLAAGLFLGAGGWFTRRTIGQGRVAFDVIAMDWEFADAPEALLNLKIRIRAVNRGAAPQTVAVEQIEFHQSRPGGLFSRIPEPLHHTKRTKIAIDGRECQSVEIRPNDFSDFEIQAAVRTGPKTDPLSLDVGKWHWARVIARITPDTEINIWRSREIDDRRRCDEARKVDALKDVLTVRRH